MQACLAVPNTPDCIRGRLAPSPTGRLHLGNAWAFLMAWLMCRRVGGQLVMRLEDIDPARSRPEYAAAIIEDLHWLGLDWDEGPGSLTGTGPYAPYIQSQRSAGYTAALSALAQAGHSYPCLCTRRELRAHHELNNLAGAPHIGDEGAFYPGTCRAYRSYTMAERAALYASGRKPCIRLYCPDQPEYFTDSVWGRQCQSAAASGGDFALCRSDGVVAYQLAVVVDDGAMRINQVVRGRDILASTPRQLLLQRLLNLPAPHYTHLPLLCDAQGERLAKRHQSLSLDALRSAGLDARVVIGYLAAQAGLMTDARPLHPQELLQAVPATLPWPDWWRERDIVLDADPLRLR